MVKFKRSWRPKHTEYYVVVTRPSGERIEYYNGQVYGARTKLEALAWIERYNARKRRYGTATLETKEREGAWVLGASLKF